MKDAELLAVIRAATTKELKKELLAQQKSYQKIVRRMEKIGVTDRTDWLGVTDLDIEDVEYYGAYLGKLELIEELLEKFCK